MKRKIKAGIRTIKGGKVKFGGRFYKPQEPYNGELDNTRWYFIKYSGVDNLGMWGDEKRYRASVVGETVYNKDCDERIPANVINGYIYWMFWEPV